MPRPIDPLTLIAAASAFGLVLAVWTFVVTFLWSRRQRARQHVLERLDPAAPQSAVARELRLWHEGGTATTTVYDEHGRRTLRERFATALESAGIQASPGAVLLRMLALSAAVGGLGYAASDRMITAAFGVFTVLSLAWWMLGVRTNKRIGIFERQLVDSLDLSARALRAGHPLLSSFQLIAEEIPAPVGPLFAEVCQEHELGVGLETALRNMTNKSGSEDLRLFAASLSINLRTGGNLADVISGLATVIRERMRLQRKFRVLTAQTQISKRILTGMPIVMFFALNVLNAEYMNPLYTTHRGNLMLAAAAGMLWSGWWIMNRMAALTR